jgi:hypothetical protein
MTSPRPPCSCMTAPAGRLEPAAREAPSRAIGERQGTPSEPGPAVKDALQW